MRERGRHPDGDHPTNEPRVLEDIPYVGEREGGALFVIHGDIGLIDADFYLLPTDAWGNVEPVWQEMWGIDDSVKLRTLEDRSAVQQTSKGFQILPCDVGGDQTPNTARAVMERLEGTFQVLADHIASTDTASGPPGHRTRPARRWLPLLAMPLIGIGRGGLGGARGRVIRELIETVEDMVDWHSDTRGAFDVVLVCRTAADYAAVQHVRRKNIDTDDMPQWLLRLVDYSRAGRLAAMFGAGASAASGLPTWGELLAALARRFELPESTAAGLKDLDPTDAATLLFQQAVSRFGSAGPAYFQEAMRDLLGLEQTTLTLSLLANMNLSVAITTNYDQGYELALQAMGHEDIDVLPWARRIEGVHPLVLKLHGDVDRGLMVLSREEFVAMHAYRRPLAGVLQDQLLSGHVLIIGSSMSDPTLVHASEEVAGLLRHVHDQELLVNGRSEPAETGLISNGTIMMGNPHPARQGILSRSLTVTIASSSRIESERTARRIDLVLDLINCLATSDVSFLLDERFSDLLSESERELAGRLREIHTDNLDSYSPSGLQQALDEFLRSLGLR